MLKRSTGSQQRVMALLIVSLGLLAACGRGAPEAAAPEPEPPGAVPEARAVTLDFEPVPPSPLAEGRPPAGQAAMRSTDAAVGGRSVTVWVHADPEGAQEEHTFLQDGDDWFDLGVTSHYGDTVAEVRDLTGDGTAELAVSGGLGATYAELQVIGYDADRQAWVLWLRAGVPGLVLEESDGTPVLIESSQGSLPPYVRVHRWTGTGFGSADVAAALDAGYASLDPALAVIEVGPVSGGEAEPGTSMRYRYRDGRLVPELESR